MAEQDEILDRMDLLQSTLELVFAKEIREAVAAALQDDVARSIIAECADWTLSSSLQESVASAVDMSERSVRRRFPELVQAGLLQVRGSARTQEYRRSPLVRFADG